MSDPMISTGITREHTCQCGTLVTQDECRGAFAGAIHWHTPNHTAPCGLPCLSGGVSPKVYRAGEFHKDASRCPRCCEGSDPRVLTADERAEGERLAAEAEQRMIEAMLGYEDEDEDEGHVHRCGGEVFYVIGHYECMGCGWQSKDAPPGVEPRRWQVRADND